MTFSPIKPATGSNIKPKVKNEECPPLQGGTITNIIQIGETLGIIGLVKDEAAILTDLRAECGICAFVCPFVSIVNELPNVATRLAISCVFQKDNG